MFIVICLYANFPNFQNSVRKCKKPFAQNYPFRQPATPTSPPNTSRYPNFTSRRKMLSSRHDMTWFRKDALMIKVFLGEPYLCF